MFSRNNLFQKSGEFNHFVVKNKLLKLKRVLIDVKIDFQEDINHEKSQIKFLEEVLGSLKKFTCGIKRGISRSRTKRRVQEKVLRSRKQAIKSV